MAFTLAPKSAKVNKAPFLPRKILSSVLAGNLCRCSGYDGQLRGIRNYLNSRKA